MRSVSNLLDSLLSQKRQRIEPCPKSLLRKLETLKLAPAPHLRVVQWGAASMMAEPWLVAGATVVGLTPTANGAKALKENQFRYHHTAKADFSEEISDTYVRSSNADLFVIDGDVAEKNVSHVVGQVAHVLDAGGVCVWDCRSLDTEKLKHTFAQAGMSTTLMSEHGRVWAVAQKEGSLPAMPVQLQSLLSRTSCVDRVALRNAWKAPLLQGPLSMHTDANRYQRESGKLFDTVQALKKNPDLSATQFNLPSVSPPLARQEKPACDVLVLLAHPDDESGFAGGTLAALGRREKRIRVVSATGGEGGQGGTNNKQTLAQRRAGELRKVSSLLGIETFEVGHFRDFGKYSDSQRSVPVTAGDTLRNWGVMETLESFVRALRTHRPRHILTFAATHDPDFALHGHHLALGKISLLAFHLAADPQAFPEHLKEGLRPWAVHAQWAAVSALHEKADHVVSVPIDVKTKRQALEAHSSQLYSLEEIFKALEAKRPDAIKECWHLVQSREGFEALFSRK